MIRKKLRGGVSKADKKVTKVFEGTGIDPTDAKIAMLGMGIAALEFAAYRMYKSLRKESAQ